MSAIISMLHEHLSLSETGVLKPGFIEMLVLNGRIPTVKSFDMRTIDENGSTYYTDYMLEIPPRGVRIGDSWRRAGPGVKSPSEFLSPTGESRGLSTLYEINYEQSKQLRGRIDAALRLTSPIRSLKRFLRI